MSQSPNATIHIFGIRHHGPGSARSVGRALEELQPDVILVEGPPDAAEVLPMLAHADMKPPVALLVYRPDEPKHAVYYPFAVFSPEWQALHFGLSRNIPVRFMDLPQAYQLGMRDEGRGMSENPDQPDLPATQPEIIQPENTPDSHPSKDPLGWIAEAAGYSDGERWWEHMVEHRRDSTDLFAGILEIMTALREQTPPETDLRESQREAFMRQTIRAAQREGFRRLAVVCGAWHAPALTEMPDAKEDAALLKDLPKVKTVATWIPWTYGRLSYTSGYGAGIESPGWYDHLWTTPDGVVTRWLTKVARLLREEDLDASSAHVIETVRLAEALAALRDRPLPGLAELNEATESVLCAGNDTPMKLIHRRLIVGERLGEVPDDTPTVPLQQDLTREQKRLRLPPQAFQQTLDLDQRKPLDLERSVLLHRLNLLGVQWGKREGTGNGKGTFHEVWRVQWQPEFAVKLIEMAVWGTTVREATAAYVADYADHADDLPTLTTLLEWLMLADLPDAVVHTMTRLQAQAALASDISHLMQALPPLARLLRYGNVRQTDTLMVGNVVDGLVARVCIGLPGACASLDDDAAEAMFKHILAFDGAIGLLQNAAHLTDWQRVLLQLADRTNLNGLIAGRCCRILLDSGQFEVQEAARRMGLALSTSNEPAQAANWIEGFVKGSGLVLLHDDRLWQVLDGWVTSLPPDTFPALLPLLRRTFSSFTPPERRQMGERVKRGPAQLLAQPSAAATLDFDRARAEAVLPLVAQLLGLKVPS